MAGFRSMISPLVARSARLPSDDFVGVHGSWRFGQASNRFAYTHAGMIGPIAKRLGTVQQRFEAIRTDR
ncbi:hypothetical protein DID99_31535 [Burkholderia sp. Bp8986]|nr:hypothetical protein DID99_31535 [Burkholderia sp. Bp8986]